MYDEKSIKKYKNVRELIYGVSPRMFINTSSHQWDTEALHVLIMHIIRQAVEPETLNQCTEINISLKAENTIIIKDNGIGLPIAPPSYRKSDTPALTHLLEGYMQTGGERTEEYYENYGFIDYLASLINVLSESLRIDTVRDGEAYTVSCSRGEIVRPLQKFDDDSLSRGTRITFKPDANTFPSPTFNKEALKAEISELTNELPQVKFEFTVINNH